MSLEALNWHLAPLNPFLETAGVTEICINRPQEIFVEQAGLFERHAVTELDTPWLLGLAALVAEHNGKPFPAPFVSATLPMGERIQFVLPPACEKGKAVCAIRRQQIKRMTLLDYEKTGAFSALQQTCKPQKASDEMLQGFYQERDYRAFIHLAIQHKKNILISGGTGTGKTTFLNACLQSVPSSERLITVEDTREVRTVQPNTAHLLFDEEHGETGALSVFKACLRLRPDRVFLSELRGKEVWPYLRAANSGHPGSLSTVHADSPEGALKQLVFMMQEAGSTSTTEQIRDYIQSVVHVIVQLQRSADKKRFVTISEVWFGEATA